MMRVTKKVLYFLIIAASLLLQGFKSTEADLPITGVNPFLSMSTDDLQLVQPALFSELQNVGQADLQATQALEFNMFVQSLVDGNTDTIRGLYVEDKFAFSVMQQPVGNTGFVSTMDNMVTDFALPKQHGVTGLLAHNYLAGADFFLVNIGDVIQVVYGDGEVQRYLVTDIQSYQALSPNSGSSNFVDLATSEELTATQLFKRVYMGAHHLTLQTCIQQGSEDSWGRLFIIADPI